jgi:hypothetical protein
MREERFETSDQPQIKVAECGGKLVVKSWRETAVSLQGQHFSASASQDQDQLSISSEGDLYLAVPPQARLTLGRIGGDLTLKHVSGGSVVDAVEGAITLGSVEGVTIGRAGQSVTGENLDGLLAISEAAGSVALRRVHAVRLERALAEVSIHFARGHVHLGQVSGPVELGTITGDVHIGQAEGEVRLVNLGGQAEVSATGPIWLVGSLRQGSHALTSQSDLYAYWPETAPLDLVAYGAVVEHQLPLELARQTRENDLSHLTGRLEEGGAHLRLKATGRVALKPLTKAAPGFTPEEFVFTLPPAETEEARLVQTAVQATLAELAAELPPATLKQLAAVRLEERLVTAVLAALPPEIEEREIRETAVAPPPPANPEDQAHILQLLKDDQLSVAQAQLLLAALTR